MKISTKIESLGSKAANYLKKPTGKTKGDNREKLWAYIQERKTLGLQARKPFERNWLLNLAFLAGKQYTFFNSTAHEVQKLEAVKGRVRKMDNKIMPKVRRQISDFISVDPIMSVVPSTTEEEDIAAAKAGDKFLKSLWQSQRMRRKQRKLGGWVFSTGNGFLSHSWNPKLGPIKLNQATGKMEYLGDVDVETWGPFDIVVPFVVGVDKELHEYPWMLKMKWKSLEEIVQAFPEKGKEVRNEGVGATIVDVNFLFAGAGGGGEKKFNGAMLVTYYEKPSQMFSRGLCVTGANGVILEVKEYPYDKYNMEHFKDIDLPGMFWGKATMEESIPLQKTWNTTISDIQEFNRTMGRGKYLVPIGANIKFDFDNVTGQVIYYKPVMGHKPEVMTLKGLPASFVQTLQVTKQSLDELFSQHEVTQGTNKSDLRSGEMVALLREQDAQGGTITHQIYEEGLEALMSGVLRRVQKGYTQPRMIDVVGRDNEVEVQSFSATDLKGNTNVSVKKQSSVPDSRIAREGRVMGRYEKGLYGDPRDPEVRRQVMNMLEDAVVKDIYSEDKRDEAVAQWENRILVQGKLDVNSYDNHMVHLKEHKLFQKSLDYQKIKLANLKGFIDIETKFMTHCGQHSKFVEEMMQRQIQQQAQMAGKGDGR